MWISKLIISNFKRASFDPPLVVRFKQGLNVLIGENNIGKTTVVEALELCLNYGSSERRVRLSNECFNDPLQPISIRIEFSGLTEMQEAAFLEALVLDEKKGVHRLQFNFEFTLVGDKVRSSITCGETGQTTNPWDLLSNLGSIFLPALRDVNAEFKPGYRSRIGKILKKKTEEDKTGFESIFHKANDEAMSLNGQNNQVVLLQKETNENIDKLSLRQDNNRIRLNFVEQEFERILSQIRMVCENRGLDVGVNGLGYNNLIFMSAVLTELKYDGELFPYAFSCLIIEEPEAHLHPQLQVLLLDFLQKQYREIQVIITSHSPTILSSVELDNGNLLCPAGAEVHSVILEEAGIDPRHKHFLQLFLDVTKSQLFFARAVIFVEGISEAILLKSIWNYIYRGALDSFDKQGIEIVNIQGVSFSPYVELVAKVFAESGVSCAVITDDDRGTGPDCPQGFRFKVDGAIRPITDLVGVFNSAPISSRARKLSEEVVTLKESGKSIDIFLARKTLEVEIGAANHALTRRLGRLLGIHFTREDDIGVGLELWSTAVSQRRKSDVASTIARVLDRETRLDRRSIKIPRYLRDAFEFVKNA